MSLSRRCALRATAGKHSGRRCAWRSCGVGARGRQRTVVARCRYQSALSRTCPTGWTYRLNVSRRCLLRPSLRWLAMKPPNLERVRACMDLIAAGGHRAGQVIDSVRAMFEKGKQEKELLNVNQLIREVLELVRGEAQRKQVIVRSNLTDDQAFVRD